MLVLENEKDNRLRLISEFLFPLTLQLWLINNPYCIAKLIKLTSSLKGIIIEKKPDFDRILETPKSNSWKGKDKVDLALFLETFLDVKPSL